MVRIGKGNENVFLERVVGTRNFYDVTEPLHVSVKKEKVPKDKTNGPLARVKVKELFFG